MANGTEYTTITRVAIHRADCGGRSGAAVAAPVEDTVGNRGIYAGADPTSKSFRWCVRVPTSTSAVKITLARPDVPAQTLVPVPRRGSGSGLERREPLDAQSPVACDVAVIRGAVWSLCFNAE